MLTPVPKPERVEKKRKGLKRVNEARAAAKRLRNFPEADVVEQWCLVRRQLAAYQREHGIKMFPAGWSRCWGPVDPAHVTPLGGGGVKSDKYDVVRLCRGHHGEQEGRTEAFEARYGLDLKAEAARYAAGERDPLPPA